MVFAAPSSSALHVSLLPRQPLTDLHMGLLPSCTHACLLLTSSVSGVRRTETSSLHPLYLAQFLAHNDLVWMVISLIYRQCTTGQLSLNSPPSPPQSPTWPQYTLDITSEECTGVGYLHVGLSCYLVRSRRPGPPIAPV